MGSNPIPSIVSTELHRMLYIKNEMSIKESTKETKIKRIAHLLKHFHHQQSFLWHKFVINEMNCSNIKIIYKKSHCKHIS